MDVPVGEVRGAAVGGLRVVLVVAEADLHVRDHRADLRDEARDARAEAGDRGAHRAGRVHQEVDVCGLDVGGEAQGVPLGLLRLHVRLDEHEVAARADRTLGVGRVVLAGGVETGRDLDEIGDAVHVAIGAGRRGAELDLARVEEAVAVGVDVLEVGSTVAVRVHRWRHEVVVASLDRVGDAVAVAVVVVAVERLVAVRVGHDALEDVGDGVAIRVAVPEVGHAVLVEVGRRGRVAADLVDVRGQVTIVVRVERVEHTVAVGVLAALVRVEDAVAIGVRVAEVRRPVAVRVARWDARGGARSLDGVTEAVAVRVGVEVVRDPVPVGVGIHALLTLLGLGPPLPDIEEPVEVGVLLALGELLELADALEAELVGVALGVVHAGLGTLNLRVPTAEEHHERDKEGRRSTKHDRAL